MPRTARKSREMRPFHALAGASARAAAACAVALGLLSWPGPGREAWALSIDARSLAAAGPGTVAAGTVTAVTSARDADGVLQTHVVLSDEAGRPVAQFSVPGGVEGSVRWVADGIPTFTLGERVRVTLRGGATGPTVLSDDDVVSSGLPFAAPPPAPTVFTAPPSTITALDPTLSGAVPAPEATVVTVHGAGFGALQLDSRVTFQGLFDRLDAPVIAWTDSEIVCRVPAPGLLGTPQVFTGPIKVWTATGGWSDGDQFSGGPAFNVLWQWAGDSWPAAHLPIDVWVNPGTSTFGDSLGPIAADAASQWDVPGSYARFDYRGLTTAVGGNHNVPLTPRDHRNTVTWRNVWHYQPAFLAITWSAIDTTTLERLEVDMEVNGTRPWTLDPEDNPNSFDLPSTLCHEFGHWLRLGHTQRVASVMTAFIAPGDRRRQISVGDAFGASWIHPSYGVVAAPDSVASGAPVPLTLASFDREGAGRAGVPASRILVRAVALPLALAPVRAGAAPVLQSARPGPLDPQAVATQAITITPDQATDADGHTTATFASLPDGDWRIEMTVDNVFVRPSPVVHVGGAGPAAGRGASLGAGGAAGMAYALAPVRPSFLRAGDVATIHFTLPAAADARLEAFDVRGRRVSVLLAARLAAGEHEAAFSARGGAGAAGARLAAGVYFVRLTATDAETGRALAPLVTRAVVLP